MLAAAVPAMLRTRVVGSVLVCGLTREWNDQETLARFASWSQLDVQHLRQQVRHVQTHPRERLHTYVEILRQQVECSSLGVRADRELHDLSDHLARSYEELSLLYRLSADMTGVQRPIAYLEKLCGELLSATVVESLAVVLEPAPGASADPTVVTMGPQPLTREELLDVYARVHADHADSAELLVADDAATALGLAGLAGRLRQLAAVDMSREGRVLGAILALNHVDGCEFRSQEIQLIKAVADRSSAFLDNVRLYDDLEQLFMGMLHALVSSIDAKDTYTCGHSQRVAWLSRYIAELAGVPDKQRHRVYLGGLLHDIGKIGVPEAVLSKRGRLSPGEFAQMKRHPEVGARILGNVRQIGDLIPAVLHHHERVDGRGYPHGLSGEQIPLFGRIVCLADSLDAMTTDRTYRQARPVPAALEEIRRCAGRQFDEELAGLLLEQDLDAVMGKLARSYRSVGESQAIVKAGADG